MRRALRPDFQTAATGCTTSGFGFHSVCVLPSLLKILSRTDEFKNMGTDNCTGTEADLLIIGRASGKGAGCRSLLAGRGCIVPGNHLASRETAEEGDILSGALAFHRRWGEG